MLTNLARLFVFSCLFVACAFAQQGRGSIRGAVTDTSGAAVPGATVVITNTETNTVFRTRSSEAGSFLAPSLAVGKYSVAVEKSGFKKVVRDGIILQVDQSAQVDLQLELGSVSESLLVTADAPLVDTSGATVGKVIENKRIQELPLNGRNALALVLLTPGVKSQAGPTNNGFGDRGIALSAISINGGPSALNSFVLDGGNNNQGYLADINANPTVDAVQEFKVQSATMSSEFGFTAGGVINVVTKSGTNQFHGAVYEFLRNDAFDARNTFAATKAPFRYNQFGGALGGPVVIPKLYDGRNKTFFFYNFEGWEYRRTTNPILSVPTALQRMGNFSETRDASGKLIPIYNPASTRANPNGSGFVRDIFAGNLLPTASLDPIALNFLRFYPLPNRTPANPFTNANNFLSTVSESRSMRQSTTKEDHRFNDNNNLYFRYTYYNHFTDGGANGAPYPDPLVRNRFDNLVSQNTILSDTHIFSPRLINETRVGAARQSFPFQAASFGLGLPAKLGLPATVPNNTLAILNNGFTGFGPFTVGLRGSLAWQFYDAITYIRGAHSIKIGADIRLNRANNFQREVPTGNFSFAAGLTGNPQSQSGTGSAFATYLLGAVSSATGFGYAGEAESAYTQSYFAQDDWRITRKLTLNLGLRYDYQQWPRERYNGLSNFNPAATNPNTGLPGRIEFAGQDFGRTPFRPEYSNFAPRFGFAYDIFGHSKTVVRGGYGIFYPSIFYRDFFGSTAGFANTQTDYNPPGGNSNVPAFQFKNGFPVAPTAPLGRALGPSAFLSQSVNYDQSDQSVPMSQQWTLSVQHQLPGNWLIDAGYSGNHATHLASGGYDLNQLDPKYLSLGTALQDQVTNPYAGKVPGTLGGATISRAQSLKPFPYYTSVNVRNPHLGESIYHAFLLSVEKRFSRGFVVLASYTKAKLISDSVVTPVNFGAGIEQVGIVGYQSGKYNRRVERSLDPTDVAQRFVLSGVYELPFGRGKAFDISNRFANALIGGWQVNSILTLQGGLPVVVRGANNNLADRPNSTGKSAHLDSRSAARWFDTSVFVNPPLYTYGNVGRVLPDVRTPGDINVDLSLIKDTHILERLRLQFRAEAFNVANHVNLGLPNASFSAGSDGTNVSSSFGTITSARDARILQLGLKLIF